MIDHFSALKTANLVDLMLFDVYRGQNLDSGKKSLAFRIVMQDTEKTLTDADADAAIARAVESLQRRFDATLRS